MDMKSLFLWYILDDLEPNSIAAIPGMGIPEQLKAAMEQEQIGKDTDTVVTVTVKKQYSC